MFSHRHDTIIPTNLDTFYSYIIILPVPSVADFYLASLDPVKEDGWLTLPVHRKYRWRPDKDREWRLKLSHYSETQWSAQQNNHQEHPVPSYCVS